MLAGHAAAAGEAFVRISSLASSTRFICSGIPLVEQQNRMDVAVAGVKHIDDPQSYVLPISMIRRRMCGSLRPRHDAVLRAIAGAQPADRAERLLAALPQLQPLLGVRAPGALRGRLHCLQSAMIRSRCCIEPGFQAVDFDQQDRLGIERKAEVKRRFDGDENALIHHLERRRNDARADDLADRVRGVVDTNRTRPASSGTPCGLRVSRTQTLVTMAERPFAADDRADQVEPGGSSAGPPNCDDRCRPPSRLRRPARG